MCLTYVWLAFLLTMVSGKLQALDLSSFYGGLVPGQEMLLLDDVDGNLSFEEAQLQLDTLGQPWMAPGQPNLGYRGGALWVKVELSNRFEQTDQWVAYTNFSNLARIDFYYQDIDGNWQTHAAGSSLPFRARALTHRSINFEFPVIPGQAQTLYFRVESTASLQFPLAIGSEEYFFAEAQRSLFTAGLYYGLMLMISIYSFTVWYSSRETGFFYFGIVVVCGGLYSLAAQGLAYQYIWPESPEWGNRATAVFSLMACTAGMMFVRTFLGLRNLDARLDIAAKYYTIAAGIALVFAIISDAAITNRLALVFSFGLTALVTLSSFLAHRKMIREASFFMSSWIILLLGIFLELVQRLGVVVPPLLAYNGIQLASLAAITVLTLGLSDRLQGMMEGYRAAQEDILRANQLKIDALQQADSV
ncbi:MAG: 7TM diverse intracellular signaling domain-containing protein, partial [Pseudohongiella sp.]|nr:7TM diverse intracellular signaling domain-containing protein [Pseudohongiella sp.]